MIGDRRFEILQSEAFGADTNKVGELEQVELLKILVRDCIPLVDQAWINLYLAVTRLWDRMTANGYIQDICQAIIHLLFLTVSTDAIFHTIESTFIVSRI